MAEAEVKIQFVAGKLQTDLRGDKLIGKEQGDHHDTIKETRVSDEVASAMLPALEMANAKSCNVIGEQIDIIEEHAPGFRDLAIKAISVTTGEDVSDAEVIGFQSRIYSKD